MIGTIPGMLFWPCATDKESYAETWKRSEFFTEDDFMEKYRKHMVAMQHVSACAKLYIINNWEKVKDWSELELVVRDHNPNKKTFEKVTFYKYKERHKDAQKGVSEKGLNKFFKEFDDEQRENQNPVVSFGEPVLDFTDGDFSIEINGISFWWIDDSSAISIADYIEKQLKKELNGDENHGQD